MSDDDLAADGKPNPPNVKPEQGYCWHISEADAMEAAQTDPGRVVVRCGRAEDCEWATVWTAQPLARLLTRGGGVVWQGVGLEPWL